MSTWNSLAALARLAPTPHNTQPFRLVPRSDQHASIVAIPDRFLPREDHGNRYMASAFGILAHTLKCAGLDQGLQVDVVAEPDIDVEGLDGRLQPVTLGHAEIRGRCPAEPHRDLLEARRTSRLPYHDRSIEADAIARLERAGTGDGHRFHVVSDPKLVADTLDLNAEAVVANLQLDDEREEIRRWYRFGATPEFGDGLWRVPLNQPTWELRAAFATPRVFAWPGFRTFAAQRYLRTQRGTRHVAILCGPFDAWPDLVAGGRRLMQLWLEMAVQGVVMQPMGSMLTNPVYAARIAALFGVTDCWLVVRLGYSDAPPRAPRLQTILI